MKFWLIFQPSIHASASNCKYQAIENRLRAKHAAKKKTVMQCVLHSITVYNYIRTMRFIIIGKVPKARLDNAGPAACSASSYFKLSPKFKHEF